jgi:lipopolysaccharide export system protein LptA
MKKCILLPFLLLLLLSPIMGAGAKERGDEPIYIRSDRLQTETVSRNAVFTGNVVARQGDLAIYADRMTVSYSDAGKEIDKVECTGKVRIIQGNRTGTAGKAVYDNRAGKIVLTVTPRVYQGDDMLSGAEIVYYLADQRSVVTGSSDSRVEAVIHPRGKEKDGGAKP